MLLKRCCNDRRGNVGRRSRNAECRRLEVALELRMQRLSWFIEVAKPPPNHNQYFIAIFLGEYEVVPRLERRGASTPETAPASLMDEDHREGEWHDDGAEEDHEHPDDSVVCAGQDAYGAEAGQDVAECG